MEKTLSILIITYNRAEDTLALLDNLYSQYRWSDCVLELLLLNNASEFPYHSVETFIQGHKDFPITYYYNDENLGVARGRNFLIRRAKGKYLLVLDDDVELPQADALWQLSTWFDKPQYKASNTAVITLNIHYFETGERQSNAFPHKKKRKYEYQDWFLTSFFIGAAHLMKRELFEKTGDYPTNFFYGMEEYDLSYRIIEAGYSIAYDSSVKILHKESPNGRIPAKERLRSLWYNKSLVSWKYLPLRYFLSTATLWSLFYLKNTRFDFTGFIKTWNDIFHLKKSQKNRVSEKSLQYLKQTEARLTY